MIITVGSFGGSPGATTLAALLAWGWPDRDVLRVVIESDPDGGVLAARWNGSDGVTFCPGLVELSTLRDLSAERLAATSQELPTGVRVVPATPSPAQVRACLEGLGEQAVDRLADTDDIVALVDVGRVRAGSPCADLGRRASARVMVLRPVLEQAQIALARIDAISADGCAPTHLVGVGAGPVGVDDVAAEAGVSSWDVVADDARAAGSVRQHGLGWRGLRRSQLGRTARSLAERLDAQIRSSRSNRAGTDRAATPEASRASSSRWPAVDVGASASVHGNGSHPGAPGVAEVAK